MIGGVFVLGGCLGDDTDNCNVKSSLSAQVEVVPLWDDETTAPEGVRVIFFAPAKEGVLTANLPPTGGIVEIASGKYTMLLYNNDSEKILFKNVQQYESHEAYTDQRSVSFENKAFSGIAYEQPDALWTVDVDPCEIAGDTTLYVKPVQQVKSYRIDVCVDGAEYLRGARGVITGMITSLTLKDFQSADDPGTLITTAQQEISGVSFRFRSFGVVVDSINTYIDPLYTHKLIFELSTEAYSYTYNIDVTPQLNAIKNGGMFTICGVVKIPSDESPEAGFTPDIEDWDPNIFPLPVKRGTPVLID